MVFSTPCCTSPCLDLRRPRVWALLLAVAWLWCGWLAPVPARAEAPALDSTLQLERSEEAVYLSATLPLELPPLMTDALHQGIAMYFVTEVEVARERWYWADQPVARAQRYLRLSYQPLTRRWRLSVSPTPFEKTGLGVVLGQNFDDLDEVLDTMQRIARWKIAEPEALSAGSRYRVQLSFRVDLSQLPRPLHIGVLGRSGWELALVRSQLIVAEALP